MQLTVNLMFINLTTAASLEKLKFQVFTLTPAMHFRPIEKKASLTGYSDKTVKRFCYVRCTS